jgi:hypothetical protein
LLKVGNLLRHRVISEVHLTGAGCDNQPDSVGASRPLEHQPSGGTAGACLLCARGHAPAEACEGSGCGLVFIFDQCKLFLVKHIAKDFGKSCRNYKYIQLNMVAEGVTLNWNY